MRIFKKEIKGLRPVFYFIFIVFITACAPKKEPDIVWPLPPDPPKVKFLYSFSSLDELGQSVFATVILGKAPGFKKPFGLHIDKEGNIYVTDTGHRIVQYFDTKKKATITLGGERNPLSKPIGVTADSQGQIYVADSSADKIYVFKRDGELLRTIGNKGDLIRPVGVAANNSLERLYVIDNRKHQIVVFNINSGEHLFDIGKRGKGDGELNFPTNIIIDQEERLYVADLQGRIQIFDQDGKFIKSFGRLGDGFGEFARPKGIGIDSEGHIYVADSVFNNVQIFDPGGQILLFFGEGGFDRGQMILPADLVIDSEDKIYVVDQWNARVNVYQYMGEKYKASQGKKK